MPTTAGQYVIGICVEEWRDGSLLSTSNRDFQFNVTVCDPNITSLVANQTGEQLCIGETLDFQQFSINATFFLWDFGVPGIEAGHINLGVAIVHLSRAGRVRRDARLPIQAGHARTQFFRCMRCSSRWSPLNGHRFDCSSGTPVFDFGTASSYPEATSIGTLAPQASTGHCMTWRRRRALGSQIEDVEAELTVVQNGCVAWVLDWTPPPPQAAAIGRKRISVRVLPDVREQQ